MGKQSSVAVANSDLKMVNHGVAQLEHFLNGREFSQLPRKELISALHGIREVLLAIESKFAEMKQIDDSKSDLDAQQKSSAESMSSFFTFLGFVLAIFLGVKFSSWPVGIITFCAVCVIGGTMSGLGDDSNSRKIKSLE